MRPLSRFEIILLVLLCLVPLQADQVVLKNGETVQGKIVSQDDKEVKIIVTQKGMAMTISIARADVASIQTGDGLREEYDKRRAEVEKLPAGWEKATKYLELGRWARGVGLFDESCAAFEGCKTALAGYDDVADLEVARTWLAAKNHDKCKEVLQRILERNPNHEQAKLLVKDLGEDVKEETSNDLTKGLTLYAEGNPRRALAVLENVVKTHSKDELALMSKACEEKTGEPLASIMIDCRFRQGCPEKGCINGWKRCPRPTCQSGKQKEYHKVVEGPTGHIVNEPVTEDYCDLCKGLKYIMCERCHGSGIWLGTPTDFEKEELVRVLGVESKKFTAQFEDLTKESKNTSADIAVRGLACMNLLGNARRARYLLEMALAMAPSIGVPGKTGENTDVNGSLRSIDSMVFNTIGGIASAYMTAAEMAYQKAVNQKDSKDGEQQSLSSRVVRAKEALEAAEQARVFILYALQDCPSSAVPMAGDMKDRLALATQFVERCRATYNRLSELERKGGSLTDNDLFRILQEMTGGLPMGK